MSMEPWRGNYPQQTTINLFPRFPNPERIFITSVSGHPIEDRLFFIQEPQALPHKPKTNQIRSNFREIAP